MWSRVRDWHQNLSWKVSYQRGKEGRPFVTPWWADKELCSYAYMQGKGVDFAPLAAAAKEDAARAKDLLETLQKMPKKPRAE